jgi:LysM repeat protein
MRMRKSVAYRLCFLLVLPRYHRDDGDVPIRSRELTLIDIFERKWIRVANLKLSRPQKRSEYQHNRNEEKTLNPKTQSAKAIGVKMRHCPTVDVHAKSKSSMFIDVRLQKSFMTVFCLILALVLGACDRMITSRHSQVIKDAESKTADGNYLRAVTLYESALDGSPRSAEIHYRLALLYDDKMHDPLSALHHFKRYLTLAPTGSHANEAKNFMKKDELELATSLSGDSVVSRAEAARLKNENLALRKDLEDQRARPLIAAAEKAPVTSPPDKKEGAKPSSGKSRTYVVRDGDTLASISRKFYKSSGHWKKIRDANREVVENPAKLKAGQTLTIP